MEHYDWARVFPELGTSGEKLGVNQPGPGRLSSPASPVSGVSGVSLGLDDADADKLRQGIDKFVATADHFAEASVNVPDFAL